MEIYEIPIPHSIFMSDKEVIKKFLKKYKLENNGEKGDMVICEKYNIPIKYMRYDLIWNDEKKEDLENLFGEKNLFSKANNPYKSNKIVLSKSVLCTQ